MSRSAPHQMLGARFKVLEPKTYNLETKCTGGAF
jgi:hypothetical protein